MPMDPRQNYVTRSEIWRVFEEVKRLQIADFENAQRMDHRMDGLEQHLDEIVKVKNVWEPLSRCPTLVAGSSETNTALHTSPNGMKGLEKGAASVTRGLDGEEPVRRGTLRVDRADKTHVRFDKTANGHGHALLLNSEPPLRPESSLGGVALTDRSLSHRSEGGSSLLARSLDTDALWGSFSDSWTPMTPPPGFFVMGPVPSIIRCWLSSNYSSETLIYAAVCSGSYSSSIGDITLRKLGLKSSGDDEDFITIPVYFPEARVHNPSVHMESPLIPSVTIKFWIREENPEDDSIKVIIGSDALRAHSADLLFSQEKLLMLDDDHQRITIPLVRPEKDKTYKFLCTGVDVNHPDFPSASSVEKEKAPLSAPLKYSDYWAESAPTRTAAPQVPKKHVRGTVKLDPIGTAASTSPASTKKGLSGTAALWDAWNHPPKPDPNEVKPAPARAMKVLRPTKPNKSM